MSGSQGAYVAVQPLGLGAVTLPIQMTDVMIVTQNGVPRECTVAVFLNSALPVWFATLPIVKPSASGQPWNNAGALCFS